MGRAAAAFVILLLFVTNARADEAQARAHLKKGVELFQRNEAAAALAEFEAADRAHHAPAITYNIARAREALGHAHSAIAAYEKYIAEAGEAGEFTSASTLAVAQLKAKCTRLQVQTTPPGALIRVDGVLIDERSPAAVYVLKGKHNIAVELAGWNDQKDVDSSGTGTAMVELVKPESPKPSAPAPTTPVAPQPTATTKPPVEPKHEPSGLMGGLALSLSGYTFVNKDENAEQKPAGIVFGVAIDVGYALGPRTALMIRALGGLGSKEGSLATIGAGGPVASFRVTSDFWLGAGIVMGAGQADSTAETEGEVTAETDTAFGPTGEITYAFADDSTGQWVVSLLPGMLITTTAEQSTVFVPLVLGHRWF
jgi:hypothetical protein